MFSKTALPTRKRQSPIPQGDSDSTLPSKFWGTKNSEWNGRITATQEPSVDKMVMSLCQHLSLSRNRRKARND